jgi:hypothetical protein
MEVSRKLETWLGGIEVCAPAAIDETPAAMRSARAGAKIRDIAIGRNAIAFASKVCFPSIETSKRRNARKQGKGEQESGSLRRYQSVPRVKFSRARNAML